MHSCSCILALVACLVIAKEDEKKTDGPVIGIDLGPTYSCFGIYKNGRVEIIPNDLVSRNTAFYVAFTKGEHGRHAGVRVHHGVIVRRLVGGW